MARPLRVEFPGAIYHITARMLGNWRRESNLLFQVRDSALRGVAARILCRYAGLSQREVAEQLHIGSGSAVSRQLTLLKDRLEADRKLEKRVATAELELERRRHVS